MIQEFKRASPRSHSLDRVFVPNSKLKARCLAAVFALAIPTVFAVFLGTSHPSAIAQSSTDPVIMAAGDIACGARSGKSAACEQMATSDLVVAANPDAVLTLGDNQYECGQLSDYQTFFGPSWGRFKDKIHPAIGNHEYQVPKDTANSQCPGATPGAPGYWGYFGDAATPLQPGCRIRCNGWYSWDLGAWHFVVLNDECSQRGVNGCGPGSPQLAWLDADLAAHPNQCTLAYWHIPRYSSGHHGGSDQYEAFWDTLYAHGVDVVLNGHDHDYERFAPQTPAGKADPTYGIREFVVGTGGRNHTTAAEAGKLLPNSEVFDDTTFGVLKLSLHSDGYDWSFVPAVQPGSKTFTDAGSGACHDAPPATATPVAAPMNGAGTPTAARAPDLQPTHLNVVFNDNFDTDGLNAWTGVQGISVERLNEESQVVAHAQANGGPAFARRSLGGGREEVSFRLKFKLQSRDDHPFNLLKIRNVDNGAILGVDIAADGTLEYRNDVVRVTVKSSTSVTMDTWHELVVDAVIGGGGGGVQIWLDGALIPALSGKADLGNDPAGWVQLGENAPGSVFDALFDDVEVAASPALAPSATPATVASVGSPETAATPP